MQMLEFSMISGIKPYCILEKATSRKLQLTKYKSTGDKYLQYYCLSIA